ncbi:phosphotransferase [Streptomyces sp. NRRL B-24484]|uniref:phosphotransferase n=1 Tax=Streptomyces sp. NRRL B-24484 TaxID=1463833 RepID=UPI0004BF5182|nr:phosphotransferase [Streptomyces sp. NRRL B-24484]
MTEQWSTHGIELLDDRVVKRFRPCGDGEPEREWRALTLLGQHCPDLAPAPLEADLAATPPTVVMARIPGVPLRGTVVTDHQVRAMAAALDAMHSAVPGPVAERLPLRLWNERHAARGIRTRCEHLCRADPPRAVRRAVAEGMRWLDLAERARAAGPDLPAVLGQADGNLANFLWDGAKVRIVDFEDSGRSDRAYELAEVVEHVSARVDSDLDVPSFLGRFDLTAPEERRLRESRRLLALLWLLILALEDPARARNPAGTAERQADRLLTLLG